MTSYYFAKKRSLVIAAENDTDEAILDLCNIIITGGNGTIKVVVDSSNDSYPFIIREKREGETGDEEEIIEVPRA